MVGAPGTVVAAPAGALPNATAAIASAHNDAYQLWVPSRDVDARMDHPLVVAGWQSGVMNSTTDVISDIPRRGSATTTP